MVIRHDWQEKIELAWQHRSIIWLAGVRRVGKTNLCQSLSNIEYFDCELPRVRQALEDVEAFLKTRQNKRLVLDEIHRLPNPVEILKIAADHYPTIKIIATGSSTLSASSKFSDTLTGRKTELWLTPLIHSELPAFKNIDLQHRLLFGGLPPFFLSQSLPESDFNEWLDSYWAKDIQELFRLEKRHSFQRFVELLLAQSGGIFEATRFSKLCEVSRQTITNYLAVLETTFIIQIIRPFTTHRPTEIVSAPKTYGFDTGFICHCKGWLTLRQEDLGLLWEHYVLNEIYANQQTRDVRYWRDKQTHEIDFILFKHRQKNPIAIECKWSADQFDPAHLKIFRNYYPEGENYVVSANVDVSYQKQYGHLSVHFISISDLLKAI